MGRRQYPVWRMFVAECPSLLYVNAAVERRLGCCLQRRRSPALWCKIVAEARQTHGCKHMGMARVRNGLRQTLPWTSGARVPSTDVHPHRRSWRSAGVSLSGQLESSTQVNRRLCTRKGLGPVLRREPKIQHRTDKNSKRTGLRLQQGFHVRHTCVRVAIFARTRRAHHSSTCFSGINDCKLSAKQKGEPTRLPQITSVQTHDFVKNDEGVLVIENIIWSHFFIAHVCLEPVPDPKARLDSE